MVKRNTPQKKIVMQTLFTMKNHPTASMVYEVVHKTYPTISKSTVFRILGNAAEDGDIRRLHMKGSDDRFDHHCQRHYHIVCKKCGRITDADIPYLKEMDERIAQMYGFEIDGHETEFTGICADCRKQGKEQDRLSYPVFS